LKEIGFIPISRHRVLISDRQGLMAFDKPGYLERIMEERSVILIVDDTPENLRVLGDMLDHKGYEVRIATNGPQALENAASSPPDLILLDILMPGMDGYEVCRRLKENAELQHIPVVFISALTLPDQKIRAFREGASDFVVKPFQAEEVVARVATNLKAASVERLLLRIDEYEAEIKRLRDRIMALERRKGDRGACNDTD
jgi:PleD family two-component response regulator